MRSHRPGPLKRVGLSLFSTWRRTQRVLHDLDYLFWECTLRCNLHCRHCGSDCGTSSMVRDMPVEDFLAVLDSPASTMNPAKSMIVLTGGEPTLRHDLVRCGGEFAKRGFRWGLVSNGLALDERLHFDLLNSGLSALTISLDGLPDQHAWLRGHEESFQAALDAIRIAATTPDISFDVATCVHANNLEQLLPLRDLLEAIGVKRWRIFHVFPRGRARDEAAFVLDGNDLRRTLDFIVSNNARGGIHIDYGCEAYLGAYEGLAREGSFFCRAGANVASVLANGDISACPSLRGDFVQGNIYRDDFWTVWEEGFSSMRDREWMRNGQCADCGEWNRCEGNGLHLRDGVGSETSRCHFRLLSGEGRLP